MSATAHQRRRREEALREKALEEAEKRLKGMKREALEAFADEVGYEVPEGIKVDDLRYALATKHAGDILASYRETNKAGGAIGFDPTQPQPAEAEQAEESGQPDAPESNAPDAPDGGEA